MRSRITGWWLALTGIAALLGCASSGMSMAHTAAFPNGVYGFQERGEGATESFLGKLQVLQDSVAVVESTPFCVQNKRSSTQDTFFFQCGDYGISAYYHAGQWTMRYAGSRTETVHSEPCVEYRRTESGAQVCARKQSQRTDRVVPFGGVLRLTPIDSLVPRKP